jgi:hypothetical protein
MEVLGQWSRQTYSKTEQAVTSCAKQVKEHSTSAWNWSCARYQDTVKPNCIVAYETGCELAQKGYAEAKVNGQRAWTALKEDDDVQTGAILATGVVAAATTVLGALYLGRTA